MQRKLSFGATIPGNPPKAFAFANLTPDRYNAACAFERAIQSGRLSDDPKASNYAGHYMYIGPMRSGNGDAFKHINTSEYLA